MTGLTKAEHDAAVERRGRPLTDGSIGSGTAVKRWQDAELSQIVTPNYGHTATKGTTQ